MVDVFSVISDELFPPERISAWHASVCWFQDSHDQRFLRSSALLLLGHVGNANRSCSRPLFPPNSEVSYPRCDAFPPTISPFIQILLVIFTRHFPFLPTRHPLAERRAPPVRDCICSLSFVRAPFCSLKSLSFFGPQAPGCYVLRLNFASHGESFANEHG